MQYRRGAGLILAAGVIWSAQGLGIRMIEQAESWAVLTWRSLGLIVALTAYISFVTRGQLWAAVASVGRGGVLGALSLAVAFGGAIYAFQATTIANAVVLFAAAPFFAALIGWAALGERVGAVTWAAIALASFGILVMTWGEFGANAQTEALRGNIAAIITALGFGAFGVSLRRMPPTMRADVGQFPVVLLAGIFAGVAGAGAAVISGQDLTPPVADIGIAMGLGIFVLAGGMVMFTLGTRTVPAAAATLLAQSEVILGPFWVWLLLGETISRQTALGGMIVLSALALNISLRHGAKHPKTGASEISRAALRFWQIFSVYPQNG
ncbi:MAG: DMT family transporter [Cypionkella sp.]|nr:DMT family transporter [Cypionkella sp.]